MSDPAEPPRGRRFPWALLAALLIGLALAGIGLDWGLPDRDHVQSYHGGESRAVGVAQQMDLARGDLEPRWRGAPFFRWGSHALYAFHASQWVASLFDVLAVGGEPPDWSRRDVANAHLVARGVSVLYALGTIALVGWIGREWFGRRAGSWAALGTALCPLLAYEARFATANTCVTFWSTAALGLLFRAARAGTWRAFALAGGAIGLAVGAKLSALTLGAPALAAALAAFSTGPRPGRGGRLAAALSALALGTLAGFALVTPYVFVHPAVFWEQAVAEVFEHSSLGHGLVFAGTGNGFAYLALVNLPVSLSHALWAAAAVGTAAACARLFRRDTPAAERTAALLLVTWIAVNAWGLGRAEVRYPRYLMPLCPFLVLAAAAWLDRLARRPGRALRAAALGAAAGIALWSGLQTLANVLPFARSDPKDRALSWFDAEVPEGSSVAFVKRPSHLTPPIHPLAGDPFDTGADPRVNRRRNYRWIVLDARPAELAAQRPDLVFVNELEVRAELRLDPDDPALDPRLSERVAGVRSIEAALRRDYVPAVAPFENTARLGPLSFAWCSAVRGWSAATQRIEVWQRPRR